MLLYNVRNKFAFFVSIGCYVLLISRVLTETLQNFSSFCHFSFEGGGEWGGGSKRKLRELIMFFLSDIDFLTSFLTLTYLEEYILHG